MIHTTLLWYPISPVAALWFVAIVPSSYLAGVIACLSDGRLAPSFRRHVWRGKHQLTTVNILKQNELWTSRINLKNPSYNTYQAGFSHRVSMGFLSVFRLYHHLPVVVVSLGMSAICACLLEAPSSSDAKDDEDMVLV